MLKRTWKTLLGGILGLSCLGPVAVHGEPAPYSFEYIQGHRCVVVKPEGLPDKAPLVLVLHGFGVDGEVCYENFHWQLRLPPCLMVFPDGILEVPHLPPQRRAWYDRFTHSYKDMEKSRDYLLAVIDHFSREPSGPSAGKVLAHPRPLVIMGESQGAMMSFETGLDDRGPLAAIVSICGFIEYPDKTLAHPHAPRKTPILMVNGAFDPVVQEEDAQATVRALRKAGYKPVLREFRVGHTITAGMMEEVSGFLQKALPGKP